MYMVIDDSTLHHSTLDFKFYFWKSLLKKPVNYPCILVTETLSMLFLYISFHIRYFFRHISMNSEKTFWNSYLTAQMFCILSSKATLRSIVHLPACIKAFWVIALFFSALTSMVSKLFLVYGILNLCLTNHNRYHLCQILYSALKRGRSSILVLSLCYVPLSIYPALHTITARFRKMLCAGGKRLHYFSLFLNGLVSLAVVEDFKPNRMERWISIGLEVRFTWNRQYLQRTIISCA